jgi:hypothetical protein
MFQIVGFFALIGLHRNGLKRILIQPQISENKSRTTVVQSVTRKLSLCCFVEYLLATIHQSPWIFLQPHS